MTLDNNKVFKDRLKLFWRPGDEIICTRVFRHSDNKCYFCKKTPIEWHHVLLNSISNQTIDVDLLCVIQMKNILEELGSNQKILFFPKYNEEVSHLNSFGEKIAAIIEFSPNTDVVIQMLATPNILSYKQIRSILDYTVKFSEGIEAELFHKALEIYLNRKYYIYENLDERDKTDNVERSIEDYYREEWERVKSEDYEYQDASYIAKIKDDDCPF
jgi:hypothetical protein